MPVKMIRLTLSVLMLFCFLANGDACLWDRDTLNSEREVVPSALETIAGKFYRHSEHAYRWRIEDRKRRLSERPGQLQWMDDLAVAYDKTGDSKEAESVAREQLRFDAKRYETLANLGTFLVHQGNFDEGLEYLRKAIEINPQAHFGREIVQIHLVEYVVSKQRNGQVKLPLRADSKSGFGEYVQQKFLEEGKELAGDKVREYTQGLLGIMRFSKHDSPILLEALGDLLNLGTERESLDVLACRAYLRAGMVAQPVKVAYKALARSAISEMDISLNEVEENLEKEVAEGEAWFRDFSKREADWIREGKDVDMEYDRYTKPPLQFAFQGEIGGLDGTPPPMDAVWRFAIASGVFILVLGTIFLWRFRARRPLSR